MASATLGRGPEFRGCRPSAAGTDETTLVSIQALRGGAALAVAAFHALQWCDGGFDVGRAGVDVFFVISGVIMWRVTAGRRTAPAAFLWRRFTRVAPLYWFATLLALAIALRWPLFLPEVRPGWEHLALSLAFVPHLDPRGLPFPTLPPGWTLDYEAIFYLVFAAGLLAPERLRARLVIGALALLVLVGFCFPRTAYFMGANPMLLQFAAGVGLGVAAQHERLPGRAWGAGLLVAAVLLWTLVQVGGLFSELWRPLVWGVPATLAVAGGLSLELGGRSPPQATRRFVRRMAITLGDSSYCLYLFHLPATAIVAHTLGYADPWLFLPVSMAVSIVAALTARAWLEEPLLRRLRGPGATRLRATSPPAASTTGST